MALLFLQNLGCFKTALGSWLHLIQHSRVLGA